MKSLLSLVLLGLLTAPAVAQIPRIISYQGVLLDEAGNPFPDATYQMTFGLYETEAGGQAIWTEAQAVEVNKGVFTVQLGAANPLELDFDRPYWLSTGLDGETELSPRFALTSAPYSLNSISAGGGESWSLTGNAGTNKANFIGTTDSTALEIRVNNVRALRIEPAVNVVSNSEDAPNMIGGHRHNVAFGFGEDVVGATISGGGAFLEGSSFANRVENRYGTVGGGLSNTAGGSRSTISGGSNNMAGGPASTVSGGDNNTAGGGHSTVGGGDRNESGGDWSVIGGGNSNTAGANISTIAGGFENTADGDFSAIGGGGRNTSSGNTSTVGGGRENQATGEGSTVPGGRENEAQGAYSFAAGRLAQGRHEGTFVWRGAADTDAFRSTGDFQFIVRATGGVGIGTNAPAAQIHVRDAINGVGNVVESYSGLVENASSGNSADVLALKIGTTGDPGTAANFVGFFDGDNDLIGQIEGNGSGGVQYNTTGSDYAEYLPAIDSDEPIHPGDIVGVLEGRVSRRTKGSQRVMVVTDRASVAGNMPGEQETGVHHLIAFIGQVPVRVRGPVRAGDYIVPSDENDGIGIAVPLESLTIDSTLRIVGRAWESDETPGIKKVTIGVGLDQTAVALELVRRQGYELEKLRDEIRELRSAVMDSGGPALTSK